MSFDDITPCAGFSFDRCPLVIAQVNKWEDYRTAVGDWNLEAEVTDISTPPHGEWCEAQAASLDA